MTIAADITAFHYAGAALALWAVILAGLGIMRHEFPAKGGEKIVMAISAILVAAAIGTAIGTAKNAPKGGAEAAAQTKPAATPPPGQPTAQTLKLSADPSGALKFDKTALQAKKGNVQIVLDNPAPLQHNITLDGPGGLHKQGPTVNKGGASQVSAALKPGKYTYYCSVPGHRQAGMQGTLTVK